MHRILVSAFLSFATLYGLSVSAQRRLVVLDMETRWAVSDATVFASQHKTFTTNSRGEVHIPTSVESITISKKGYVPLTVRHSELKDTLLLLPADITLNEVVVTAKRLEPSFSIQQAAMEAAMAAPHPGGGHFDMAKLLERHRISRKTRQKIKKALDEY